MLFIDKLYICNKICIKVAQKIIDLNKFKEE